MGTTVFFLIKRCSTNICLHFQGTTCLIAFPWREQLTHITCPILLVIGNPEARAIDTQQTAQEAANLWKQREVL